MFINGRLRIPLTRNCLEVCSEVILQTLFYEIFKFDMEIDPFKDPELTYYEPIPCFKRFKRNFRMLDLYALPVTFRYKGEKKFYTNFGAATSLVLLLCILGLLGS